MDGATDGLDMQAIGKVGSAMVLIDAMGNQSRFTYSSVGQLLSMSRSGINGQGVQVHTVDASNARVFVGYRAIVDSYSYDQAGRQLSHTNGDGETMRYAYDLRGNLVSSKLAMGQETRYTYDTQNRKTAEVDANGYTATWRYDYFGQLQARSDIGGARYKYTYDNARQLVFQRNTRGLEQSFIYDAAGQLTGVLDFGTNQNVEYQYDLAGNKLLEKTSQWDAAKGQYIVYQDNHMAYDALGRLRLVADGRVSIQMDYDKAGNRKHILTRHSDQNGTFHETNRYFLYDEMNRQTTVDAITANGIMGFESHYLKYDKNGNRISDTSFGNKVTQGADVLTGYLPFDQNIGYSVPQYRPGYTAALGIVTEEYSYDALDRLSSVTRDGQLVDTRVYDGADRLSQSGPANAIDRYYAQALYGTNANGSANPGSGTETHLNRFDDNGRLLFQRVWDAGSTGKTDTNYQGGYDAAGNLKSYSVFDYASNATNSYQMALDRRETYQQTSTSGSGTRSQPGASHSQYDVNGNLTAITDDRLPSNNRTLVNDISGKALQVSQSGNVQRQMIVGGEVLARYGVGIDELNPRDNNGNPNFAPISNSASSLTGILPGYVRSGADFNFGYQPINGNYPSASVGSYQVATGDTLQSIAQGAYGDSSLWYRIADANGLSGNSDLRVGQTLSIPNRVGTVHNYGANSAVGGASSTGSFKPYDPSKVQGDSTPNLPAPQAEDGGCGGLGQILIIIVAIVVTVYTAGAFAAASGGLTGAAAGATAAAAGGGAAGTFAAGAAALGGTYGAGVAVAAGVIGGIAGSVVSQGVGIAIGVQEDFSWKGVALAAIGGAVSGGLAGSGAFAGAGLGSVITRAAVGNALTQGIAVVTGLQDKFSWKGVAAAAVGAGVSFGVSEALSAANNGAGAFSSLGEVGGKLARASLTGFAAGLATAAARGGRVNITQVATDAFGQALGESFKEGLVSAGQQEMALREAQMSDNRAGFRRSEINDQNWEARIQNTLNLSAASGPGRWDDATPQSMADRYVDTYGGEATQVAGRAKLPPGWRMNNGRMLAPDGTDMGPMRGTVDINIRDGQTSANSLAVTRGLARDVAPAEGLLVDPTTGKASFRFTSEEMNRGAEALGMFFAAFDGPNAAAGNAGVDASEPNPLWATAKGGAMGFGKAAFQLIAPVGDLLQVGNELGRHWATGEPLRDINFISGIGQMAAAGASTSDIINGGFMSLLKSPDRIADAYRRSDYSLMGEEIGGLGLNIGLAAAGMKGSLPTAKMGLQLAAEDFGASAFGQRVGAGIESYSYKVGNLSYAIDPAKQLQLNRLSGEAYARDVIDNLLPQTQVNIQPEITIRSNGPSGLKVRLDALGQNPVTGTTVLSEMKGSQTAPFTSHQNVVYPELGIYGGTVVGQGKAPYVGGTVIPPTNVDVYRKK